MVDKKKALNLINKEYSDSEIGDRIKEMMSKVGNNSGSTDTRYQYSYTPLEYVIENPQEYIIPECMLACKCLWDKNIGTFMVSNYDDNFLYVLLADLSDENLAIIKEFAKVDTRYFWDEFRHYWGIRATGVNEQASRELAELTNVFVLQDTIKYQTAEDFLDSYKRTNGELSVDEYGNLVSGYNPNLANATLEEALVNTNCTNLYVPEEGKIYDSLMYLEWHNKYKDSLHETISR